MFFRATQCEMGGNAVRLKPVQLSRIVVGVQEQAAREVKKGRCSGRL